MSKYRELELLREQENTLTQLHIKFSDQLNRLKVEELALTNLLRLQKEREMQAQTGTTGETEMGPTEEDTVETQQVLDLLVSGNLDGKNDREEEEEEEEDENDQEDEQTEEETSESYNDQLKNLFEGLLHQQQNQGHHQQQLLMAAAQEDEEEEEEDFFEQT